MSDMSMYDTAVAGVFPFDFVRASASGTPVPGCRVFQSAHQSIPNLVWTDLTFDTASFNADQMWSSGVPTRITVNTPGRYLVALQVEFASFGGGASDRYARIRRNGGSEIIHIYQAAPSGYTTQINASVPFQCLAKDYFTASVIQNTGGALNVMRTVDYSPVFWVSWLSA